MELALGIVIGIALTLVVFGVSVWLLVRRSVANPLPEMTPPFEGQAAVLVMMIEPFLNHQLHTALEAQTNATELHGEHNAASSMFGAKPSRFHLELQDASLDVQTGQRARFYAQLIFTAWNFHVLLRPIADMMFALQDGRVRVAVTDVQLGGVHVPRALVDRFVRSVVVTAEEKLNHSLRQLQQDTGVQLAHIETTEDLMILRFVEPQARADLGAQK